MLKKEKNLENIASHMLKMFTRLSQIILTTWNINKIKLRKDHLSSKVLGDNNLEEKKTFLRNSDTLPETLCR